MADFSTESEMDIVIPDRELRDARSKIERELGDISVAVDAQTADAGPSAGDTSRSRQGRRGGLDVQILNEQLDVLEEINDNIEKAGGSGFDLFGGGGGGGNGEGLFGGLIGGGVISGGLTSGILEGTGLGGLLGGGGSIGTALRGTTIGFPAIGQELVRRFVPGINELKRELGPTTTASISPLMDQIPTDQITAGLEQELRNMDFSLGLLNEVQTFDQQLSNVDLQLDPGLVDHAMSFNTELDQATLPELDPELVQHATTFKAELNNVSLPEFDLGLIDDVATFGAELQSVQLPDLDPGLVDEVQAFEQQLNQIQPPSWVDELDIGNITEELDGTVSVDFSPEIDIDSREIRREVEQAIRREMRGINLDRLIRRTVRDEFGVS